MKNVVTAEMLAYFLKFYLDVMYRHLPLFTNEFRDERNKELERRGLRLTTEQYLFMPDEKYIRRTSSYLSLRPARIDPVVYQNVLHAICDFIPDNPDLVVDVGCELMPITRFLRDMGWFQNGLIGIEPNPFMCKEAQGLGLPVVEACPWDMPMVEDCSSDFVFCQEVLHLCLRWPDVVSEMCRISKGIIAVTFPADRRSGADARGVAREMIRHGVDPIYVGGQQYTNDFRHIVIGYRPPVSKFQIFFLGV